jgi:hypothetical protein
MAAARHRENVNRNGASKAMRIENGIMARHRSGGMAINSNEMRLAARN